MPTPAAIALGSNVGERESHLRAALLRIAGLPRTRLVTVSTFHTTRPVGPIVQGDFINAAAIAETDVSPLEFLSHLHRIERERGRDRAAETVLDPGRWTSIFPLARSSSCTMISSCPIHVFTNVGSCWPLLAEIAGEWLVPTKHKTVRQLLGALPEDDGPPA